MKLSENFQKTILGPRHLARDNYRFLIKFCCEDWKLNKMSGKIHGNVRELCFGGHPFEPILRLIIVLMIE